MKFKSQLSLTSYLLLFEVSFMLFQFDFWQSSAFVYKKNQNDNMRIYIYIYIYRSLLEKQKCGWYKYSYKYLYIKKELSKQHWTKLENNF